MKYLLLKLSLVIIALTTIGCNSLAKGPAFDIAKASTAKPNYATIYIFREYAEPTHMDAAIYIDQKWLVSLRQKGVTWFYIPQGKHKITTTWSAKPTLEMEFKEGQTYYVELTGISQMGKQEFTFNPESPYTASINAEVIVESNLNIVEAAVAETRLQSCCKFQKPKQSKD